MPNYKPHFKQLVRVYENITRIRTSLLFQAALYIGIGCLKQSKPYLAKACFATRHAAKSQAAQPTLLNILG